jgi:hypothetical protein
MQAAGARTLKVSSVCNVARLPARALSARARAAPRVGVNPVRAIAAPFDMPAVQEAAVQPKFEVRGASGAAGRAAPFAARAACPPPRRARGLPARR